MNYQKSVLNELAAQYVLGTLPGRARRRMERICQGDTATLSAVREWEDKLSGLNNEFESVQPPTDVWSKVQWRVRPASPVHRTRMPSRLWFAAAAALALFAVSREWWSTSRDSGLQPIATVIDKKQALLWRIEKVDGRDELRLSAPPGLLPLDPSYAYELWALSESGDAPVSLGLLPLTGERLAQLTPSQTRALGSASRVAVSQEPHGGSRTGAPTGPVLFVVDVSPG